MVNGLGRISSWRGFKQRPEAPPCEAQMAVSKAGAFGEGQLDEGTLSSGAGFRAEPGRQPPIQFPIF